MLTISNHLARFCTYRHEFVTIQARKENSKLAKKKYRSTPLGKVQTFKTNYMYNFMKRSPEPEQYSSPFEENSLESCWFKTKENLKEYTAVDAFLKQHFISIGRYSEDISANVLSSLRIIADWMCDISPMKVRLSQAEIPCDCREWLYCHVPKLQRMFHPDKLFPSFLRSEQYPNIDEVTMKDVSTWLSAEFNGKKDALKRGWDVVVEDGLVPDDSNDVDGNTFAIDNTMPLLNRFELESIEDYKNMNVNLLWLERLLLEV